ncbi:MAG: hypothetical protein ABSG25_11095 [Bryobacteraceae bacterium]
MESKFVPAALRSAGVALLFAACGALSSYIMSTDSDARWLVLAVPLPFVFLSFLLFLRHTPKGLLALPLNVAVWFAAYRIAGDMAVYAGDDRPFLPMLLAGTVGGLGVTLAAAIGYRRLLSAKYLIAAAIIGGVSAVPFGLWLRSGSDPLQAIYFRSAFAIWQAAVGTFLYVVCNEFKKAIPPESSAH